MLKEEDSELEEDQDGISNKDENSVSVDDKDDSISK